METHMDYNIIDYIIRKKNYSLYRYNKETFDIIKNESGTYGEFYDFIIKIHLCDDNCIIKADVITHDKEYEIQIKKIVNEILFSGKNQFDKFCFAILEYNL